MVTKTKNSMIKVFFLKEFARAIESFEERLLSVETSVQREIMAIKSISESLRASVAALQSHLHN